jgi:hypothetical protein
MSEYAVNRQTGEVLKRDQSGSWQKVKSAKNASGEILINEGSGWGAVPSASAQPAPPASPFLQRGMSMVQGAMATEPQMRASLPLATGPDRMQNRTDSAVLAKAREVQADIESATRKARVGPVEREAGTVGRAETLRQLEGMSPFVAGFGGANAAQIAGDAQSEQVYDRAGVMSSAKATDLRTINALAQGIPGILNKDFRADLAQAGVDQPGAAMLGDIQGIAAPAMATWNTAAAGVNALARPFIPRGADAASRTVRYGAPLAGQVAGAAATNAAFQAGVQEPIRAETAGEDLTLGGMAAAAKRGLEDPLNLLPLGLSAVNRTWNQLTSGIATPSARAADMANRYGVGPRQTAASQGIAQTTQALGGQLQGADIRGLTNIENALRFALRDNRNIPDVNARIATGFQRIRESLPLEDDPTLNLARLIEREFAPDAPQTRDIIRNFLRGVGLNSPGGGQIVGDAANQMRGQQADVLRTELESSFGAQPKTEAQAALQESLDQFSAAYNNVMPQAPRTGPQADEALDFLVGSQTNQLPPQTNLQALLYQRARAAGMTVDNFILQNPLEALHWVQSDLADQARGLRAANTPDANLERVVQNMQRPLRDALPEYGQLQNLWRQYSQALGRLGYTRGAEAGVKAELSTVPGFGDKIFGPGGISKSEQGTQTAADLFLQMDDLSQRSAGLSVRDVINDELRKAKAAGLEERYQTAANMRRVATEGGLDALRRVFGEAGDRVARRIEQFMDANEFARNIDPEFNSATMNKAQAMATGAQPFAGPMGQATQSAAGSLGQNAFGDAVLLASGITNAPMLSAMRAVPWLADRLQPGARTQRNIAETLLRRGEIGSQVSPRPGGPAPITPIDPAMVPGARPPPGGPPPGGTPPAGGTPPQAPSGRTVGVAPATAAMPTPAPVPPSQPPAMAAPVMPPPAPAPSPAPAPARSGPPPFPPPLEAMEWTGPIPREPGGLLAFIRKLGGIREEFGRFQEQGYMRGSVAQFLGDVRSRPGLLNNKSGQTIDELARSARDAGFDIGDDEDFMRQLGNELQGRGKSYRIGEAEEWNAYQDFLRDKTRAENSERVYDEIPFGFGRTDATNALAGGTLGGIAPAESPEDRARNMAIGAGIGGFARRGSQMLDDATRTVGQPRATSGRTVGAGLGDNPYFGRQSLRPPGSGPSPREIETQQQWATATPIVTQARTTAQSAQQAADAALQSKAPADIARAKDAKKTLVGQLQEAQASRAGMDTPEDARLAETLASLTENTSDPVLLSTQISAAKTSLDRLLTDIGSPVEGNLIPVKTNILTRTQAPRSAAEGPQDRASVTRYAEGSDDIKPMGFGASTPKTPEQAVRFETPGSPEWEAAKAKGLDMSQAGRMARAKEMGFDKDVFHATDKAFDQFDSTLQELGTHVGTVRQAEDVIRAGKSLGDKNPEKFVQGAQVMPLKIRGKYVGVPDMRDFSDPFLYMQTRRRPKLPFNAPAAFLKELDDAAKAIGESRFWDQTNRAQSRKPWGEEVRRIAKKHGIDGFRYLNEFEGTPNVSYVVFDPANIRSVNAAFDPEKSGSSTLLAAAPFAAVGGAGLTLAGEDARNQRTVGKPKTSQSARTVGKAKTN